MKQLKGGKVLSATLNAGIAHSAKFHELSAKVTVKSKGPTAPV